MMMAVVMREHRGSKRLSHPHARGAAPPEGPAAREGSVLTVSGLMSRNLVAQNNTVYRSEVLVGFAGSLARVL